ncbi:MAG: methylated-DNA--[protein]-cysteine S-methyltransferase [Pseudomonadota bacterium]|jgi:methylated-DNA-[protein]-cysteine S-methyltransferase|nr:methylated-DNA--[protein]-cysteine S-methyltransferase [Pseudomonadota bacterium]
MTPTDHTRYWHILESPVGPLLLGGDDERLTRIDFQDGPRPLRPGAHWHRAAGPFAAAIEQLAQYFAGQRRRFDLPLAPTGTPFQLRVWEALCAIPYGETLSYGDLARRVGNPRASRAVGLANGANPLPIVVPCHRVIGANGALTGFGGGVPIKRALLALEGALPAELPYAATAAR